MLTSLISQADHSFIYPQRLGPARISAQRNMRMRYLLVHPEYMKGKREFMRVLTARTHVGVEFVERWQASRMVVAILLPVIVSLVTGVVYSGLTKDVSSGFTVAGEFSALCACAVSSWLFGGS